MTAFANVNRYESFRRAFADLLSLEDDDRQAVVKAAADSADAPDDDATLPSALEDAYSALVAIRALAADDGVDAVIADINDLYPEASEAIEKLGPHFVPTVAETERRLVREVETSTLPFVIDGRVTLDYRVTKVKSTGEIKLVPLFIARLALDEPVGGNAAVTFQISAAALANVRSAIDDAFGLLSDSSKTLGEGPLFQQTLRKYE